MLYLQDKIIVRELEELKKFSKLLLCILLVTGIVTPTVNVIAKAYNGQEKFRVIVETTDVFEKTNLQGQHGVRWQLDSKRFTTEMNEKQFTALQKNNTIIIEKVNVFSINDTSFDVNSDRNMSILAATQQVALGIKSIYDESNLTRTSGGSNILITVLDIGVNSNHPDMNRPIQQCKDFSQIFYAIVNEGCEDRNGAEHIWPVVHSLLVAVQETVFTMLRMIQFFGL